MINNNELKNIIGNDILLCDGAMGTLLQGFGFPTDPSSFLSKNNEFFKKVTEIHLSYLENGSNIIQTNTFSSNPIKLSTFNVSSLDDIKIINQKAVYAAKTAIEVFKENLNLKNFEKNDNKMVKYNSKVNNPCPHRPLLIAGNIGPTGKLLEPFGDLSYKKAVENFKIQTDFLISSGNIDIFLIETMMDINEALAAIEAIKDTSNNIAIVCTLTFNEKGVTLMGNRAETSVKILTEAGCSVVGANCSVGSDKMLDIVKKMREADRGAKLIFQPNAGVPKLIEGKTIYTETPEIFAKNVKKFLSYNPSILGGCCGSTPEHIKKIAELINKTGTGI